MTRKLDRQKDFASVMGHPLACFEQEGVLFDKDEQEVPAEQLQEAEKKAEVVRNADVNVELNAKDEEIGRLKDELNKTRSELQEKLLVIEERDKAIGEAAELVASLQAKVTEIDAKFEEEYMRAEALGEKVTQLEGLNVELQTRLDGEPMQTETVQAAEGEVQTETAAPAEGASTQPELLTAGKKGK